MLKSRFRSAGRDGGDHSFSILTARYLNLVNGGGLKLSRGHVTSPDGVLAYVLVTLVALGQRKGGSSVREPCHTRGSLISLGADNPTVRSAKSGGSTPFRVLVVP